MGWKVDIIGESVLLEGCVDVADVLCGCFEKVLVLLSGASVFRVAECGSEIQMLGHGFHNSNGVVFRQVGVSAGRRLCRGTADRPLDKFLENVHLKVQKESSEVQRARHSGAVARLAIPPRLVKIVDNGPSLIIRLIPACLLGHLSAPLQIHLNDVANGYRLPLEKKYAAQLLLDVLMERLQVRDWVSGLLDKLSHDHPVQRGFLFGLLQAHPHLHDAGERSQHCVRRHLAPLTTA
mmetsp:Transcript_31549/g.78127  ORF Transcript_31549/g.78127 Transcript_31549/m.78127 type:complete len:236 (-) Transcript_31549:320-1027(-)